MKFWFLVNIISGLLIIVPAFAAFSRLKTIWPSFLPFVIILWAGFFNELAGLILIYQTGNNTALYNIAGLVYGLLILWQFGRWKMMGRFSLLQWNALIFICVWVITLFYEGLNGSYTFFILLRAFCIVAFSYHALYMRIQKVQHFVYRDAIAIISASWLLLFIYDGIKELLLAYSAQPNTPALFFIQPFFSIINILVQVVHLYAILCMPPKAPC